MFIYNINFNMQKIKRYMMFLFVFIILLLLIYCGFRFYNKGFLVKDSLENYENLNITSQNYTNILRDSFENIDNYVGKKIKFSGFIYRLYDFNENQFVLGREMIFDANYKAMVVGFLCYSDLSINFETNTWVEIEGIIEKGYYHGDMPVIKVVNIEKINTPEDELVSPPDNTYIPTT